MVCRTNVWNRVITSRTHFPLSPEKESKNNSGFSNSLPEEKKEKEKKGGKTRRREREGELWERR